ncbi:potassium-transporting ATPase subunit C [Lacunimicrobium album]
MFAQIRISVVMLVLMTALTGGAYPAVVTLIAQTFFPYQANGSLIVEDGTCVGSELIGQQFSEPKYFWSRLSATGPVAFNAAASSGSNYGPMNPALKDAVTGRIESLRGSQSDLAKVPVDLVTASASGLDPHISPASAQFQIARVANARNLEAVKVRECVDAVTEGRQFGFLGEPRVNVLKLNLALDSLAK